MKMENKLRMKILKPVGGPVNKTKLNFSHCSLKIQTDKQKRY